MPAQAARLRTDLAFCRRAKRLPAERAVLLEVGVHGPTGGDLYGMDGPAALWKYARFHGLMSMRGFLAECGLLRSDGPVPSDVVVPPGAAFDKYRPGAIPPPVVLETPVIDVGALPLVMVPATKAVLCEDYKTRCKSVEIVSITSHGKRIKALKDVATGGPIRLLQRGIGVDVDGIAGYDTRDGIVAFQRAKGLEADGIAGNDTWTKLLT
jgi:peptidoglycan hydrolase-like protein with peptidoglycan-binding domain